MDENNKKNKQGETECKEQMYDFVPQEPWKVMEPQAAYRLDEEKDESRRLRLLEEDVEIGDKTLEDYLALPEGMRTELIDGRFYDMASPSFVHSRIASRLLFQLEECIDRNHGSCIPLGASYDVQLDQDDKTVVIPDVMVICDREGLHMNRFHGAPDLIIEIVSPGNWRIDVIKKRAKYERAGVREYWMIFPEERKVTVCYFEGKEDPKDYSFHDKIPVRIWDGKGEIDFEDIYERIKFTYDQGQ